MVVFLGKDLFCCLLYEPPHLAHLQLGRWGPTDCIPRPGGGKKEMEDAASIFRELAV